MDVVIPSVGESVTEGTIGRWYFKSGDIVQKDQALFELDSDKASMEVTAEATGKLEILMSEGETASVGTPVARIDTSVSLGAAAKSSKKDKTEEQTVKRAKENLAAVQEEEISKVISTKPAAAPKTSVNDEDLKELSPSQRRAVRSGKTSLADLKGKSSPGLSGADAGETRHPMTTIRKRIAERLLQSQQTTATLTTFNEVDMSTILELRKKLKEDFQKKFGIKLGFMSFFSKAVITAMEEFPIVNAHIDGTDIVEPQGVHLGIAVSTERGLVVPVVRNAQTLSYADLEKSIADLADRARDGKLSIPEMQGGSFTLTNGGVFGSLLSTPILNPPQSGILGMHKTEQRPMAIPQSDGSFKVEVRPMMYLALSYDHRIIDGKTSVGFLVKCKEYLENVTEKDVMG